MAVSPFTYDLYLQMRSERHMDLISSLALLSPYRDGWKDCWPCGLAFKAVLRSRHLSSLPCVDVTVLSGLEVLHYDPCLSLALVPQQQRILLPFRTTSRVFFTTGKCSLCFLSQVTSSCEWFDLHILGPIHLMPVSLDLVMVWYLDSSRASQPPVWMTCKYKVIHITIWLITFCTMTGLDWPGLESKTKLGVQTYYWHSMTKIEKLIWQI